MRDMMLELAGALGLAIACIHGVLGETKIFARAQITPEYARLMTRLGWQCGATAWFCFGALLILAPSFNADTARHAIIIAASLVYAFGALANAWGTKARHFGWAALLLVISLSFAGW